MKKSIHTKEKHQHQMANKERKALRSQLIRLMKHIIKFIIQVPKRSRSWITSINNARLEIQELLTDHPSLKPFLVSIWSKAFIRAKREAEKETDQDCDIEELDWDTTFNQKFDLDDDPDTDDDKPKK